MRIAAAALTAVSSARADQKNLQVSSGLSDVELQRTMNMVRTSLGVHCDFCHVIDDKTGWDFASDAKTRKRDLTGAYSPAMPSDIPKDARVTNKDKIGDRDTIVVNGRLDEKTRVRCYFDETSGSSSAASSSTGRRSAAY